MAEPFKPEDHIPYVQDRFAHGARKNDIVAGMISRGVSESDAGTFVSQVMRDAASRNRKRGIGLLTGGAILGGIGFAIAAMFESEYVVFGTAFFALPIVWKGIVMVARGRKTER